MASDSLVTAKHILAATLEQQRLGPKALEDLEKVEPELASYLMENLSLIHQRLITLHAPPKKTLRLLQSIEGLAMVCISAMRIAHRDLWDKGLGKSFRDEEPPET